MPLTPTDTRCMGLNETNLGLSRCPRRNTCERYLRRTDEGVKVARLPMCPTESDYYGNYLPIKGEPQ